MNYYIITGTTKGIGSALNDELVKDSNNFVFALNRSSDIRKFSNYQNINCDIAKDTEIETAFTQINEKIKASEFDSIVLINNAGIVDPIKFINNTTADDIEKCFAVNVLGTINTTRCFLKNFKDYKCKKIIANISSGAASKPMAGWSIYTATKAAVEIFTKSVALEQLEFEYPTTIFAFQPGKVETPMQKYVRNQEKADFPDVDIFIDSYKNNENYTPEFIAQILLKLLTTGESGNVYKARELKEIYNL